MSKTKKPSTFTDATEQFIAAADWIGAEHAPAVISLRLIATQLDSELSTLRGLSAALVAQYNLTYRGLLKARPIDLDADDPLEKALREVGQ